MRQYQFAHFQDIFFYPVTFYCQKTVYTEANNENLKSYDYEEVYLI